jgi:hypothetical protein
VWGEVELVDPAQVERQLQQVVALPSSSLVASGVPLAFVEEVGTLQVDQLPYSHVVARSADQCPTDALHVLPSSAVLSVPVVPAAFREVADEDR